MITVLVEANSNLELMNKEGISIKSLITDLNPPMRQLFVK